MGQITIKGDNSEAGILKHWQNKTRFECAREILSCYQRIERQHQELLEIFKITSNVAGARAPENDDLTLTARRVLNMAQLINWIDPQGQQAAAFNHIETLKNILIDSVAQRDPDFVIGEAADPYLIRWWLRRDRPEGSIYLHKIIRSDDDRALHDRPWPSTSIVLHGTLREILPDGSRLLTPGSITSRTAKAAHRLEIVDGPVWTLFITGAVEREWGFHCPNGWVHWKEFTDPGTNGQTIGRGCGE